MHDADLEDRAQAAGDGDRAALSELYDALSPGLFGYLADMTCDPALAEDLLHQAWIRVMEKIGTRRSPIRPWVFTIARNLALDVLRARRRSREIELGEAVSAKPGPDEIALDRDDSSRLRDAVRSLSADQRDVVLLRFYSGLTFKEIAIILDCPMGTAVTRLRKALCELRETLNCEQRT